MPSSKEALYFARGRRDEKPAGEGKAFWSEVERPAKKEDTEKIPEEARNQGLLSEWDGLTEWLLSIDSKEEYSSSRVL